MFYETWSLSAEGVHNILDDRSKHPHHFYNKNPRLIANRTIGRAGYIRGRCWCAIPSIVNVCTPVRPVKGEETGPAARSTLSATRTVQSRVIRSTDLFISPNIRTSHPLSIRYYLSRVILGPESQLAKSTPFSAQIVATIIFRDGHLDFPKLVIVESLPDT